MRNLIAFLARNSAWFVFICLEALCILLLVKHNAYQQSVICGVLNELSGKVYRVSGGVKAFLYLSNTNRELMQQNGELAEKVLRLEQIIREQQADSAKTEAFLSESLLPDRSYEFVVAQVVNNSVSQVNNYITIDKGAKDGIRPDMGVVSGSGIVGIVSAVSDNYSRIIPVLHSGFRQSVKISRTNNFGTLLWNGRDIRYAAVDELPRHQQVHKGDTVVTSGFSGIFPEGILVGVVEDFNRPTDDNFYNLKVQLFTNFHNIRFVHVIINNHGLEERWRLEAKEGQDE